MKVEFTAGIDHISGTMKSRCKEGTRFVFMTRRGDKPGRGRMYLRNDDDYKRSTPLSPAEIAARDLFSRRSAEVKRLMTEEKYTKKAAWEIAKKTIF